MIQEFKPTILFLLKFLGLYFVGSLIYGFYVTYYEPSPDPITVMVTEQTAFFLEKFGWSTQVLPQALKPIVTVKYLQKSIIEVYEGCNGVNVLIIFIAFIVAFGPNKKNTLWFVLGGSLIIYASNLIRIVLLFLVALHKPHYLYFSHKYLFTAFIYAFVLVLWMIWVKYFSKRVNHG